MPKPEISHTWDGKPISGDPPYGATIIVYLLVDENYEYLILHRSNYDLTYSGDWAWTPPSGARYPDEPVDQCAQRELIEETGLRLPLQKVAADDEDWAIFITEAKPDHPIELSPEHDLFAWVKLEEALARCQPDRVRHPFTTVDKLLKRDRSHGLGK